MTSLISLPGLIAMCAGSPQRTDERPIHLDVLNAIVDHIATLERTWTAILIGDESRKLPPLAGFRPELDMNEFVDFCDIERDNMLAFMGCMAVDRSCYERSILVRKMMADSRPEIECYRDFYDGRLPTLEVDFSVIVVVIDSEWITLTKSCRLRKIGLTKLWVLSLEWELQ